MFLVIDGVLVLLRFDRDPGNQWLRSVINAEFGGGKLPAKRK